MMETKKNGKRVSGIFGGLLVFSLAAGLGGCAGKKSEEEFKTQKKDVKVPEPELHHEHGPHQGHVADLGADHKYRVEVTFKKDPRTITAYVMEHDSDQALALDAPMMTLELEGKGNRQPVTLSPEPEEDDPQGKSSRFVVTGQAIPASVQDLEDIHGHLQVKVGEKTLKAEFGHDHEEGEEHAD